MILRRIILLLLLAVCKSAKAHEDTDHPRYRRSEDAPPPKPEEQTKLFWIEKAQSVLQRHLEQKINTNVAKNVILFLGDGMSIPTLAASRVYNGQLQGSSGEETTLHFENFPYTGLSRTYCVDSQVADSACSATAYLGGVKSNMGTVGVTAAVERRDCAASSNTSNHVLSIAHWAQNAGKSTGLVTTTRVTHASPAGIYAHVADRHWEDDDVIQAQKVRDKNCQDIAQQLILGPTGSRLNVIMGGGRKHFFPNTEKDEKGIQGIRKDKQNLIEMWMKSKRDKNVTHSYITDKHQLLNSSPSLEYLLGLFSPCHMNYHLDNPKDEPTLEEMTRAAIKNLQKNRKGYFLFVEGGRIDHAHHGNLAKKSLDETVEFAKAVAAADDLTREEDTLIVVTADHAHVMTMSGYADRGNNILGYAGDGSDGLPYSTLSYANGPGFESNQGFKRADLRKSNPTGNKLYRFPAMVPLVAETHGGDDVAVFAKGPWAHLFTGSYEQHVIPHVMGFASCIGKGLQVCRPRHIT